MKFTLNYRAFAVAIAVFISISVHGQTCTLIGEMAVEAISASSLFYCSRSGDPVACSVATALLSTGNKMMAKKIVTAGCTIFTKMSNFDDDVVILKITGDKTTIEEAANELDNVRSLNYKIEEKN